MGYKVTGLAGDTGTSIQFGAVDMDKISQLLLGVDLTSTDPVVIGTQWTFKDQRLHVQDPAGTRSVIIKATNGMSSDRQATLPVLSANDTFVFLNQAQTLTNKTIAAGSNTVTGIADANITAHTTTKISTTNKSLLNSAILYNDVDISLGAHYHDITQMTAPGSPASGTRRIYCDSGNSSHFTIKKSDGTTLDIEAAVGGAGDMFLASTQTVTGAKTFTDTKLLLRNPANTFSATLAAGAQTANQTFTFPVTSSDTIVTAAASQTLTNKSLTSPAISTISNTGTLTLPTSSDTLLGRATTDTISNKTIAIDSNTIKHSTTNVAGDLYKSDGTKVVRVPLGTANQVLATNGTATDVAWTTIAGVATREDLEATFAYALASAVGTAYTNMKAAYANTAGSFGITWNALDDFVNSIDFTGKTQFRAQFNIRREINTTSTPSNTPSIRVVDSTNSANVLFEKTGISTDTLQTVTLTSLPGWCSGRMTIVPQAKTNTGTNNVEVVNMMIWLK